MDTRACVAMVTLALNVTSTSTNVRLLHVQMDSASMESMHLVAPVQALITRVSLKEYCD